MKMFIKTAVTSTCLLLAPSYSGAGTWSSGSFDNDDARDWAMECAATKDLECLADVFEESAESEYLEAGVGAATVAAAEVVAAVREQSFATLPPEFATWAKQLPVRRVDALGSQAITALRKVTDPKVSELAQLWSEKTDKKWQVSVNGLIRRLSAKHKDSVV